jgi:hypothetical protein
MQSSERQIGCEVADVANIDHTQGRVEYVVPVQMCWQYWTVNDVCDGIVRFTEPEFFSNTVGNKQRCKGRRTM